MVPWRIGRRMEGTIPVDDPQAFARRHHLADPSCGWASTVHSPVRGRRSFSMPTEISSRCLRQSTRIHRIKYPVNRIAPTTGKVTFDNIFLAVATRSYFRPTAGFLCR